MTALNAADRSREELVGAITHELRTPLTAIKGFIELVADGEAGPITDMQRDFLGTAAREADRLAVLIEDLLDWHRIESQLADIRVVPVEIQSLLAEVATTFHGVAQVVEVDGPPARTIPKILGNAPLLVHVLRNVVSNAMRCTPGRGVEIRVSLAGGGVEVIVQSSGDGDVLEKQGQVFARFSRDPGATLAEPGGTELGLVIARAIIERHHGTVAVDSKPAIGSRYRIMFPVPAGAMLVKEIGGARDG